MPNYLGINDTETEETRRKKIEQKNQQKYEYLEGKISDERLRELKGETVSDLTSEDVVEALRQFRADHAEESDTEIDGDALSREVATLEEKTAALDGRVSEEYLASLEWKRDSLKAAAEAHEPHRPNSTVALAKRADLG